MPQNSNVELRLNELKRLRDYIQYLRNDFVKNTDSKLGRNSALEKRLRELYPDAAKKSNDLDSFGYALFDDIKKLSGDIDFDPHSKEFDENIYNSSKKDYEDLLFDLAIAEQTKQPDAYIKWLKKQLEISNDFYKTQSIKKDYVQRNEKNTSENISETIPFLKPQKIIPTTNVTPTNIPAAKEPATKAPSVDEPPSIKRLADTLRGMHTVNPAANLPSTSGDAASPTDFGERSASPIAPIRTSVINPHKNVIKPEPLQDVPAVDKESIASHAERVKAANAIRMLQEPYNPIEIPLTAPKSELENVAIEDLAKYVADKVNQTPEYVNQSKQFLNKTEAEKKVLEDLNRDFRSARSPIDPKEVQNIRNNFDPDILAKQKERINSNPRSINPERIKELSNPMTENMIDIFIKKAKQNYYFEKQERLKNFELSQAARYRGTIRHGMKNYERDRFEKQEMQREKLFADQLHEQINSIQHRNYDLASQLAADEMKTQNSQELAQSQMAEQYHNPTKVSLASAEQNRNNIMRAGQLQQASHELAHNQAERANLNHVSNLQTADQSKLANMESRVKLGEVLTAHDQKQLDDANLLHREARNYPMEQLRNFNEITQNIPRPPKPNAPIPQQPSGWTNIAGGVGQIASQLRQDQINASNQKLNEEYARSRINLMNQQMQSGARPLKTGGRVYLKTGGIADQIMFKLKQANMPDPRVNQFDDMLKLREIEAKKQNISPNESFASNFFGSLAKSDPNEQFLQTIGKGLEAGHQGYKAQAEQNNAQYEKLSAIDSIMANTFSKIASDEDKMGLEREKLDLEREKIGALRDEKSMALDLRNQQQTEANRHRHITENKKILDLNNATLASAKKFMPVLDNAINALERMKQKGLKLGQVGQQTAHNISTHLSSAIANRSPFGAFDQESRDLMDMFDSSIRSYLQMRASDLGGSRLTNALLQTLAKDKPDFSKGYDANLEILLHQRDLLNQASEEAKFVNQAIHEGMNPEEAYALLDRQMGTQKTDNGRISTQEHVERILSMTPDEVRNYKKTLSKEELEAVKTAIKSGRGN